MEFFYFYKKKNVYLNNLIVKLLIEFINNNLIAKFKEKFNQINFLNIRNKISQIKTFLSIKRRNENSGR